MSVEPQLVIKPEPKFIEINVIITQFYLNIFIIINRKEVIFSVALNKTNMENQLNTVFINFNHAGINIPIHAMWSFKNS